MGYDTSVVLARGAGLAGLEEALGGGYRPTGKVVGFQEASAKKLGKALAVTALDPWLVVWDPGLVTLCQALAEAPHRARRAARDAAFERLRGDPRFEALIAGAPTG